MRRLILLLAASALASPPALAQHAGHNMPGMTMPSLASTSSAPSGAERSCPTSAIRLPTTSTSPPVSTSCRSSIVSTVAPRNSTGRPSATSS